MFALWILQSSGGTVVLSLRHVLSLYPCGKCYLCTLMVHVIFVSLWYMLSLYLDSNVIYLPCRFQIAYCLHCTCSISLFFSLFFFLFLLLLLEATSGMQQKKCQIYCYFVFRVHVCRYALFTFALPVACLPKMSVVYISVSEM